MPKIQLLDPHVAELIAAGEVVERPSSVVKELMENAIDAGATAVTVEIESGGVRLIRVTDNGCGISREDVPTAFLRHATSKVRTEEDLDRIGTLGFRGEALASIAAVSRVELVTRTEEELAGTVCQIEGGSVPEIGDIGCPVGTSIYVRDLFYNVPARMKFLKKDVSEGNAVAAVVDCLSLSHPEVSVRFVREQKEVLHTPGNRDMCSCIRAVLGREFANNLIQVEYSLAGLRVWGYVGKPVVSRSNRTMQHFFINGRYVKTRTAAAAVERAFQGAIMVGKFPACVLYMEMPCEMVDVNVHPAKIEVRFVNERPIFDAVYHGVKSALHAGDTPKQILFERPAEPKPAVEQITIATEEMNAPAKESETVQASQKSGGFQKRPLVDSVPVSAGHQLVRDRTAILYGKPDVAVDKLITPVTVSPMQPASARLVAPAAKADAFSPTEQKTSSPVEPTQQVIAESTKTTAPIAYIGEIFRTYLIIQQGDGLYFIDKHAAHERIIYNQLKKTVRHDAQMLLVPITVNLTHKEIDVLVQHLELLHEAGFDAEEFDGSLLVRTVPMMLTGEDVQALMQEIAGGFLSGRQEVSVDKLAWIYHSVSCRAAVKAGDTQSPKELEALAARVLSDKEIRYCPHGRPVCFELTKKELEKQFGRI